MKTPNIFNYANHELSQDAFLCWLIACADSEDTSTKNLGLDFIAFLYNSQHDENHEIHRDSITGFVKNKETPYPWKQHYNTDVYFQAVINNKTVSFVIEHKTESEMRRGQLEKYKEWVQTLEGEIRLIYYKRGYIHTDEEEKANKLKYNVIGAGKIVEFLSRYENKIESDIFQNYLDYVRNKKMEIDKKFVEMEKFYYQDYRGEYCNIFCDERTQSEFMRLAKGKIEPVLREAEARFGKNWCYSGIDPAIRRGQNKGGKGPWTQFWWAEIPGKYQKPEIHEVLYWRMDGGYQLRLCCWVWPGPGKEYEGFREYRKKRLYRYREIFEEEGRKIFHDALEKSSGRTGDESTIGKIIFNSPENSVKNVLEKRLPEFQRNFMNRIFSDKNLNRIL